MAEYSHSSMAMLYSVQYKRALSLPGVESEELGTNDKKWMTTGELSDCDIVPGDRAHILRRGAHFPNRPISNQGREKKLESEIRQGG